MDDVKSWLASKTIWGAVIAVVSGVSGILGHNIAAPEQAVLVDSLTAIGTALGGILAVYGRVKAEKSIG